MIATRTEIKITPAIEKRLKYRCENLRAGSTLPELAQCVYIGWKESRYHRAMTDDEMAPFLAAHLRGLCRTEKVLRPSDLSQQSKQKHRVFETEYRKNATCQIFQETMSFSLDDEGGKIDHRSNGNIDERIESDRLFSRHYDEDLKTCYQLVVEWLTKTYGKPVETEDGNLKGFGNSLFLNEKNHLIHRSNAPDWAAIKMAIK